MLKTLRNAFKIEDIRKKLLFTGLILIVVRLGCEIPIPGVNRAYISDWFSSQLNVAGGALGMLNSFTGGSFTNMSLFALNITPYITSSIIMQLLTIAVPALEEMQKEGEDGRKKIAEYTRYLTIALAFVEGAAMAIGFGRQGLLTEYDFRSILIVICAMVAGTSLIMWLGERITAKGVGNGISIVLTINILSSIPNDLMGLYNQFIKDKSVGIMLLATFIIIAVVVAVIVFVVILQNAERRIPIQYAKKVVGRKTVGGQTTHIPLKVNTSGVIPIIFASSLLQLPTVIGGFFSTSNTSEWTKYLNSSYWFNIKDISDLKYSIGLLVYILLVIIFAYFYTSVTFNPIEVSNNIKKNGGFIPGIRPGKPTSDYLNSILNNVVFIGACGLIIVAITPFFFSGVFGANVSFGGTSIIIIVGVVLETLKQIESQMLTRHYTGFLND